MGNNGFHRRVLFFHVVACLWVLAAAWSVHAEPSWRSMETKHTILRYTTAESLKSLDAKIDFTPEEWTLKRLFSASSSGDLQTGLSKKIDALHERVQQILGMPGKLQKKIIIELYADDAAMHRAYEGITRSACNVRAWYFHKKNTVYISVHDVHEGMLAHELAHGIIDNYMLLPPPRNTAEILAHYVDKHLTD